MDKEAVLEIISRFRLALERRNVKVSKIILYGSYSAGNYDEGSDIDLVVVSDDFADKGYWERIDSLSDAIFELFEPIEAVAMTPEEWDNGDTQLVQFARKGELEYSG